MIILVDTAGIGEGPLTISIINVASQKVIPAQILHDAKQAELYHIQWLPNDPGFYSIHVQFASVDCPGLFIFILFIPVDFNAISMLPLSGYSI